MIKYGEKTLTELPEDHPFKKHFNKCSDYLKELGLPIRLMFTPDKIRKPNPYIKDDRGEKAAGVLIPTRAILFIDGSEEEVIYYESMQKEANGVVTYRPAKIDMREDFNIDKNQIDKAFFLTFVSPHCAKLLDEKGKKLQTATKKRAHFLVQDRKRQIQIEVDLEVLKSKVHLTLFGDKVSLKLKELKDIAHAYGVPLSDNLIENELRISLKNKILERPDLTPSEQKTLIEQFLNDTKTDERVKLIANVNRAVESKLINIFKGPGGVSSWHYVDKEGERGEKICTVKNLQDPRGSMVDYYREHEDAFKILVDNIKEKLVEEPANPE